MIDESVMDTSSADQQPPPPTTTTLNSFNVEQFRLTNESDLQWNFRKQFIETFRFDYNEDRLLCLAQCYANTQCLGCKYSEPLKSLLEQLSEKLTHSSTNKRSTSDEQIDVNTKRNAVPSMPIATSVTSPNTSNVPLSSVLASTNNFVSFSSTNTQAVPSQMTPTNTNPSSSVPNKTQTLDPKMLLYESAESKLARLMDFAVKLKLCAQAAQHRSGNDENDHAIEHIYQVGNQQRLFVDYRPDETSLQTGSSSAIHAGSFVTQTFRGKLYIDEVFICAGQGSNKKFCKRNCFQQAFNRLMYENFDVKFVSIKDNREQYELVVTKLSLINEQQQHKEEFGIEDDSRERESFVIPSTHPMANSKLSFVHARDTSTMAERTARQQIKLEQQYWQQWGRGVPFLKPRRTQRSLSPPPPVPHQSVMETTTIIEAAPTTAAAVAAIVDEMEQGAKEQQQEITDEQFFYPFPARPGGDQPNNPSIQPICSEAAKAAIDSVTVTQQRAKLCKMQPFLFSLLNTLADASHSIDLISTQINKYHLHAEFDCADQATTKGFHGHLIIEQIQIADGFGITKKLAKKQAYANGLKSISAAKSFSLELRHEIQWTLICHPDETGMIKVPPPRRPMALRNEERPSRWGPPTTLSAVTSSTTSAVRHLHERRMEEGSQREREFSGVCIPPPALIEPPLTRANIGQDLAKCTSSTDEAIVNNIRRLIPNTFVVFELLDFDENIPGHYVSMLFTSMQKNKLDLKYEFTHVPNGSMITYMINNRFFMSWVASTKIGAKQLGAKKAIELLKTLYPSIKTKHVVGDMFMNSNEIIESKSSRLLLPRKIITRSQLYEQPQSMTMTIQTPINGQPKEDMGAKLLKKMGWIGGGIGKDLQGIAEPIQIEDLQGRKGLGSNSLFPNQIFVKNLRYLLEDFISTNDNDGELQFANEFNSEERKSIHKEAMKLHLTSNSYGRDGERRIRITQKRNVDQLVDHLLTHGGETARYELKAQTHPKATPLPSRRDPMPSTRRDYSRMGPPPSQQIAPDACDDESM